MNATGTATRYGAGTPTGVQDEPQAEEQITLRIEGMHCASCVSRLEGVLGGVPGVRSAQVSLPSETAVVTMDASAASAQALRVAVAAQGYKARQVEAEEAVDSAAEDRKREYRDLMKRFWIGLAISIPVMITAWPDWFPILRGLSHDWVRVIWGIDGLLTLVVLAYVGKRFFTGGWSALKHRNADMNTLIALG
ncbi:MAG: cation transporter, partial [Candidatus Longimicrobiales bacterium M2_2A_002]